MAALSRINNICSSGGERNVTLSLQKLQGFTLEKGFDYIESKGISTIRCKEQGFRFFTASFVHKIEVEDAVGDAPFEVSALCWRSQRKNEPPHRLTVICQPKTGIECFQVRDAHCSCQAGINAGCAHVPALFYCISTLLTNKFVSIPEELSCTSLPQQWGVPRGNRIKPAAVMDHVFDSNSQTARKKRPQHCTLHEARQEKAKCIDENSVCAFKKALKNEEGIVPLAYLLTPACSTTNTAFGSVQYYSPLSYQLTNFSPASSTTPTQCSLGLLPQPNNVDLSCEPVLDAFFTEKVSVSVDKAVKLATDTVKQAQCPLWKKKGLFVCSRHVLGKLQNG